MPTNHLFSFLEENARLGHIRKMEELSKHFFNWKQRNQKKTKTKKQEVLRN